MTSRERVKAAMHFQKPDRVPVQYHGGLVGYYEHGDKLNDLFAELDGDFAPYRRVEPPKPPASDFDENGLYHAIKRDDWGVLFEYRIFLMRGMPLEYPCTDPEKIKAYKTPEPPNLSRYRKPGDDTYYHLAPGGELLQRLIALRSDEEVLMDIISDESHIHELAEKIMDFNRVLVKNAIASGADGISFADDYGTELAPIMSPRLWKEFIFPRLQSLFKPARDAGLDVHFHSCGHIWDLLPLMAEAGVTSVWPQIPVFDMAKLARRCRELGLAIAIHTDRAKTMTFGKPGEVRDLVYKEYETFKLCDGGGWFYIEVDNGFPWENVTTLVRTVKEIVHGKK